MTASKKASAQKLVRQKLRYQKRKEAGLCCYGTCTSQTTADHTLCQSHLSRMSRQKLTIYEYRKNQKRCRTCGVRPQFWGMRCIICRELVTKNPLPRGARRALREYRKLESRKVQNEARERFRNAARELIAGGSLKVKEQEALRYYLGLNDNEWRTHQQVADLMNVSAERVRQLLLPSKKLLSMLVGTTTPWRSRTQINSSQSSDLLGVETVSRGCRHRKNIQEHNNGPYTPASLPDVVLHGLTIFRCAECEIQEYKIPQPAELYDLLAQTILQKSDLLSGREVRFLRKAAGLTVEELAKLLNVSHPTLKTWETLRTLRSPSEIAVRSVLGTVICGRFSRPFNLPTFYSDGIRKPSVIRVEWIEATKCWQLQLVSRMPPQTRSSPSGLPTNWKDRRRASDYSNQALTIAVDLSDSF